MEDKIGRLGREDSGTAAEIQIDQTKQVGDEFKSNHGCEQQACIICGEKKADGISIVSEFICEDCEAEMVHTDVKDDKYDFFIHQMKQIWLQLNA